MTVFFTSDTHFGHYNIISHCNRPFSSVREMEEIMIQNWNSVVKFGDTVYHLGDFTLRGPNIADTILARLNGNKHLILGNHDRGRPELWVSINEVKRIKIYNQEIWLSHYSHRVWPSSHHGAWHLFGHSHGKLPPYGKSFDVGVDTNNFIPLSFDEVEEKIKTISDII